MRLFTNKKHTQCAGAAMAGDCAACFCPVDVFKALAVCVNGLFDSIQTFVSYRCPCNKEGIAVQVLSVIQTIFNIVCKALCITIYRRL